MSLKQFPHITRIITAALLNFVFITFTFISLLLFLFITTANYYIQIFPENKDYVDLKVNTLKSPLNPASFTILGTYLFNNGLETEAYKNFQIANATSTYQQLLDKKRLLSDKEHYWEKLTVDFPNYRDAHIQMGVMLYQLGKITQSKDAINLGLSLDPLYPNRKVLGDIISED